MTGPDSESPAFTGGDGGADLMANEVIRVVT
jgi:hypothetical protein